MHGVLIHLELGNGHGIIRRRIVCVCRSRDEFAAVDELLRMVENDGTEEAL